MSLFRSAITCLSAGFIMSSFAQSSWTLGTNVITANPSTTTKVGIGTTTPASKLHVVGKIITDSIQTNTYVNVGGTGYGNTYLTLQPTIIGMGILGPTSNAFTLTTSQLNFTPAAGGSSATYSNTSATIRAPSNANSVIGAGTATFTGYPSNYYGITNISGGTIICDKKVGIGVTNPTERLEVAGTIKADAVKIKNWSIEAPDYVFADNYNLKPLTEVESFIEKNNHLPEVPSAAEMKQNGVDLSELNMTLLKKVEELTLYTIEQNKRITELEKQLNLKK